MVFRDSATSNSSIIVDSTGTYQSIDGFGACLTGGSAYLINKLPLPAKDSLLKELFTTDSNAIGISYIRVSMGASDLSSHVFSYDDLPAGQADSSLDHFNLSDDLTDLIPVLQKIVCVNPQYKNTCFALVGPGVDENK
ncbi:MAG: hypothetical protein WDO19_22875 [Bacteroidota bacterium]